MEKNKNSKKVSGIAYIVVGALILVLRMIGWESSTSTVDIVKIVAGASFIVYGIFSVLAARKK